MFSQKKTVENFQQLFAEVKNYVELQKEYIQLDVTERLTLFFSKLILVVVGLVLGLVALFYASFALVYLIEPYVAGGLKTAFAIVAGANLLIILLLVLFKNLIIVKPLIKGLASVLLPKKKRSL